MKSIIKEERNIRSLIYDIFAWKRQHIYMFPNKKKKYFYNMFITL